MPREHDLVIVGSGGGGLVAGLVAKANGLDPLVIEKTEYLGGTTALSHSALWLPNNPLGRDAGFDSDCQLKPLWRSKPNRSSGLTAAPSTNHE